MEQHIRASITIDYSASAELSAAELQQRIHDEISAAVLGTERTFAGTHAELTGCRIEVDRIEEEAAIYGNETDQGDGIGRYYELQQLATDCMATDEPNVAARHRGAGARAADLAAYVAKHDGRVTHHFYRGEEARYLLEAVAIHENQQGARLSTAELLLVAAMIAARAEGEELAAPQLATEPLRVLVALEGGCVQGAVADRPGVSVTVLDYDTEGADAHRVFAIPQRGAGFEDAFVGEHAADHDPAFIDAALAADLAEPEEALAELQFRAKEWGEPWGKEAAELEARLPAALEAAAAREEIEHAADLIRHEQLGRDAFANGRERKHGYIEAYAAHGEAWLKGYDAAAEQLATA